MAGRLKIFNDVTQMWEYIGWGDRGATGPSPTPRFATFKIMSDTTSLTAGDSKFIFTTPTELDAYFISSAQAAVTTASSSGDITINISNLEYAQEILSTPITIDQNTRNSYVSNSNSSVNINTNQLYTADRISIDIDNAGVGAKGLEIILSFSETQ